VAELEMRIVEMYRSGLTAAQIARVLYMSDRGVLARLEAAGVPRRPARRRPCGHLVLTDDAARRLWEIRSTPVGGLIPWTG
jgi:hypothetical protein